MAAINRNLIILFCTQLVFTSGSVLMVTLGGIAGGAMSGSPSLATLPVSLMVVGTACTTVPAALLMQRFGRRLGFVGAAGLAAASSLTAALALEHTSFVLFCLAAAGIGATLAFGAQFRFAAAESVPIPQAGFAVSFILVGSIGGAFLGPELVARGSQWQPEQPFQATMFAAAVCYLLAGVLLTGIRPAVVRPGDRPAGRSTGEDGEIESGGERVRPLREIAANPAFQLAVLAGVIGYGVMTFVMTATPISMHVVDGHDLATTAGVIRTHVLAMYLPSLVSGPLIRWLGVRLPMLLGAIAMLATVAIGLSGHAVLHYGVALALLGVGWNFLYVGGTTLLVTTYRPSERYRAQAVNDFSVFGTSAAGSLMAGTLMHQLGWSALLLGTLPLLGLMLVGLAVERARAPAPSGTI